MGARFSRRGDKEDFVRAGSDTDPGSITPLGRGPNGELIFGSHDQNVLAEFVQQGNPAMVGDAAAGSGSNRGSGGGGGSNRGSGGGGGSNRGSDGGGSKRGGGSHRGSGGRDSHRGGGGGGDSHRGGIGGGSNRGGGGGSSGGAGGSVPGVISVTTNDTGSLHEHRTQEQRRQNRLLFVGAGSLVVILVVLGGMVAYLIARERSSNDNSPSTTLRPTSRPLPTPMPSPIPTTKPPSPLPSATPTVMLTCPVCHEGPTTFPDPFALLFPSGSDNNEYDDLNCQGLSLQIEDLVRNSNDPEGTCLYWQVLASVRCGCEYPPAPVTCPICPDGTLPSPDTLNRITTVEFSDKPGTPVTCLDLLVKAATTQISNCTAFAHYAEQCHCPGHVPDTIAPSPSSAAPTTSAPTATLVKPSIAPSSFRTNEPTTAKCRLCEDGKIVRDDYLTRYSGVNGTGGQLLNCQDLEVIVLQEVRASSDECQFSQLLGALNCGCNYPFPPEKSCSLCPNGEYPPLDSRWKKAPDYLLEKSNRTCQDVWVLAALTPPGNVSCQILQTRNANPCGCTNSF